jgi:signal transduction histidine kinase
MLAAAEGIKDEFVSTITHELVTPMTSIKGALSLLKTDAVLEDTGKANRLISIAHENTERLLTLVNSILSLHKSSSGEQMLTFSPVDLADIIQVSINAIKNESAKRAINLGVFGTSQPCLVNGDRKLLELVITNVLSNALKYAQSGGNVAINLNRLPAGPQITVTDDGAGIPQGSKSKVFGMFSQVDSADTRMHSGIGLGMYMCRKILQAHGSSIDYTSTVGVGTTFALDFPMMVNEERLCG